MLQDLARRLLALMGWKLIDPPTRPPRAVLVAYPHTSNWDALHALLG
jgi:1-acyl-sn-glycerol-3-phosphate acyltransferase